MHSNHRGSKGMKTGCCLTKRNVQCSAKICMNHARDSGSIFASKGCNSFWLNNATAHEQSRCHVAGTTAMAVSHRASADLPIETSLLEWKKDIVNKCKFCSALPFTWSLCQDR